MTAPKRRTGRKSECLDMGSGNVTLSRDALFAAVRDAIKGALVGGRDLPPNTPDAQVEANAQGRASQAVNELLHSAGGPGRATGRPDIL